jgi:hypothetical protein
MRLQKREPHRHIENIGFKAKILCAYVVQPHIHFLPETSV